MKKKRKPFSQVEWNGHSYFGESCRWNRNRINKSFRDSLLFSLKLATQMPCHSRTEDHAGNIQIDIVSHPKTLPHNGQPDLPHFEIS